MRWGLAWGLGEETMTDTDDNRARLAMALQAARAAWPTFDVPDDAFSGFLNTRDIDLQAVTSATIQDLYLACACAKGVPGALSAFGARYRAAIAAVARTFDDSPAFADEVEQRMNELLFVDGPGKPGRIARYLGQGPLGGFVTTTARRIAMRLFAGVARFQGEEALVRQFADTPDQETLLLKARYRETFNRALPIALRQLPRRDRIILRLNLVDHVSTTKLAVMYGVNQSTVSRWIDRAGKAIFQAVKELICDELDVDTKELRSLLTLVRSQIELTFSQSTLETGDLPRHVK
jgi:RNA polymerase sigma-70 factor (ECF subfamily)